MRIQKKRNSTFNFIVSEQKSPTNGGWGEWSEWTECSASCNGGVRIRERLCNNPLPENGGASCTGNGEEEESCNEEACVPRKIFINCNTFLYSFLLFKIFCLLLFKKLYFSFLFKQ